MKKHILSLALLATLSTTTAVSHAEGVWQQPKAEGLKADGMQAPKHGPDDMRKHLPGTGQDGMRKPGPEMMGADGMKPPRPQGVRPPQVIYRDDVLRSAAARFDAADANKDGALTEAEHRAYMERLSKQFGPRPTPQDGPLHGPEGSKK